MKLNLLKFFVFARFILFYFSRTEFCYESQGLILNNQVLTGHSYKSVIARGILGCTHKCLVDPACTSYNYQNSAAQGGLCELNEECTKKRKELFEERRGFVFVRMKRNTKPRSCLEAWKQGARTSGLYIIQGRTECLLYEMFCDFSSEPGWAWTLVMSQSFGRRNENFATTSFQEVLTRKQHTPNWEEYRIRKGRLWKVKEQSSHWRVTCDFSTFGVDYKDYARASFKNLNPLTYEASGKCREMDYINIRGHNCTKCTASWWQTKDQFLTHFSDQDRCQFGKTPGGGFDNVANFGGYWKKNVSLEFRCSANETSNTNHWFGGRV